jgi:hypothetical protein
MVLLNGLAVRETAVIRATFTATTGGIAGAVEAFGSLDGVNFFSLGSPLTITATGTQYAVISNAFVQYVRAQVTTTVTGGTISATVGLNG